MTNYVSNTDFFVRLAVLTISYDIIVVLIILLYQSVYQINLTNILGKIMKQLRMNKDETIMDVNVNDLPKGKYIAELKMNSAIASKINFGIKSNLYE